METYEKILDHLPGNIKKEYIQKYRRFVFLNKLGLNKEYFPDARELCDEMLAINDYMERIIKEYRPGLPQIPDPCGKTYRHWALRKRVEKIIEERELPWKAHKKIQNQDPIFQESKDNGFHWDFLFGQEKPVIPVLSLFCLVRIKAMNQWFGAEAFTDITEHRFQYILRNEEDIKKGINSAIDIILKLRPAIENAITEPLKKQKVLK